LPDRRPPRTAKATTSQQFRSAGQTSFFSNRRR